MVVEAVDRELKNLARRDKSLAESGVAAGCRAVAAKLDDPSTSATAAAACLKALVDGLDRLRALAPPEVTEDLVDELSRRRGRRTAAKG